MQYRTFVFSIKSEEEKEHYNIGNIGQNYSGLSVWKNRKLLPDRVLSDESTKSPGTFKETVSQFLFVFMLLTFTVLTRKTI